MYTPEDILKAREERVDLQRQLQERYKMPLLNLRVNYPGLDKTNEITKNILDIIYKVLLSMFEFEIYYRMLMDSAEGPTLTMIIDKDAYDIKKLTLEIEEKHTLGRCVDIDVYDINGRQISRKYFHIQPRKCFICDDYAHNCVRSKKHSIEELKDFINEKYNKYMNDFYGDIRRYH